MVDLRYAKDMGSGDMELMEHAFLQSIPAGGDAAPPAAITLVAYTEDKDWVRAEVALRFLFTLMALSMLAVWVLRAAQNFFGDDLCPWDTPFPRLRSGQSGTANALSLWLCLVIVAYLLTVNPVAPFSGNLIWVFIEAHSEAFFFISQNSFCIAFVRICYYSCKFNEKSWLQACYPALAYFIGGMSLHFATAYAFADQVSCGNPNGMGISYMVYPASRPKALDMECVRWEGVPGSYDGFTASSSALRRVSGGPFAMFAATLGFHILFLLYGLREYLKLSFELLPSVPFSPNACAFLLARWFSYFGCIYMLILIGVFLHVFYNSRDGGGESLYGNNRSLGNMLSNTIFTLMTVVSCFPLARKRKRRTASPMDPRRSGVFLNAISELRAFADRFSLGRLMCGTRDEGDDDDFSDTTSSEASALAGTHRTAVLQAPHPRLLPRDCRLAVGCVLGGHRCRPPHVLRVAHRGCCRGGCPGTAARGGLRTVCPAVCKPDVAEAGDAQEAAHPLHCVVNPQRCAAGGGGGGGGGCRRGRRRDAPTKQRPFRRPREADRAPAGGAAALRARQLQRGQPRRIRVAPAVPRPDGVAPSAPAWGPLQRGLPLEDPLAGQPCPACPGEQPPRLAGAVALQQPRQQPQGRRQGGAGSSSPRGTRRGPCRRVLGSRYRRRSVNVVPRFRREDPPVNRCGGVLRCDHSA